MSFSILFLIGFASIVRCAFVGGHIRVDEEELALTSVVLRGAERDYTTMPLRDGSFAL